MASGIWQSTGHPVHFLSQAYVNTLNAAGLIPVLVPPSLSTEQLRELFGRVDGLLLSGGGDMNPACSGIAEADMIALADDIDDQRDSIELTMVKWAHAENKPLLGICRGHQVMNVAMGGSLLMDIPALVGTEVNHRVDGSPAWRKQFLHPVRLAPDSRLATYIGPEDFPVNSIHHQAIAQLAPALQASAWSPDGLIEGIEDPNKAFFLGVQWHPEEIYERSPQMQALFRAFKASMS
jgi:putative glutamine amidotransferase